jgi:7-carboxy-7-deazaguanine synthase
MEFPYHDLNKPQPIIELYKAVQSEGSKAGIPHIILRTTGCTHRCYFGEGGWCDSFYTSIHPEKGKFTLNDVKTFFNDNLEIDHLMLTGGSPTMHPELCNSIIVLFKQAHNFNETKKGIVTLETEGSHSIKTNYLIDLVSFSPKFSNSVPKIGITMPNGVDIADQKLIDQHNKTRLNKTAIKEMMSYHKDYHFKPVCNPEEQPEIWAEIEAFRIEMGIPKSKTWIMPPGDSREEILRVLPMVINYCSNNGYCFSGRDHILAFDKLRGV